MYQLLFLLIYFIHWYMQDLLTIELKFVQVIDYIFNILSFKNLIDFENC